MPGLALVLLGVALFFAVLLALIAYRTRDLPQLVDDILADPDTPAAPPLQQVAPPACDAAVEGADPDGALPPALSGSDTPRYIWDPRPVNDLEAHIQQALDVANDRSGGSAHIHTVCGPCGGRVICFRSAAAVTDHLRGHYLTPAEVADFAAWRQELQS